VSPGHCTDAYNYNLIDAEPRGNHCCTHIAEYRVIVGCVKATPDALVNMQTSFVPLADQTDHSWEPTSVGAEHVDAQAWVALTAFIDGVVRVGARGPARFRNQGAIAQFPSLELAYTLCRSIVARSGHAQGRPGYVAIPPLVPLRARRRTS
jgi:hypothetical protein